MLTLEFAVALAGFAAGGVRRGSYCGGFRFAKTPLRCSGVGCAAELAALRFAPFRSDSRSEHVHVARCARQHSPLRFSPPQKSPRRTPPAAKQGPTVPPVAGQQRHCKAARAGTPPWGRLWDAEQRKGECRRAQRASCSDSLRLSERSAQRVASSAVRPNPEQRRGVAAGDRSSEAARPVRPAAQLCLSMQRALQNNSQGVIRAQPPQR